MTSNKKPLLFLPILYVLTAFFILTGCANIQRPMGGPRDRIPPKLLKATPLNQTRNFSAKQIQLDFDEYFKLNNQYTEITVTPNMEKMPEFNIKSKSLVIKLKDTLAKNTTYVINFGKAIADVNEGNVLKNFTYVFSTGPNIDSLSISGNVINTLSQVKEKDVTVLLFPLRLDTLFGKKKPAIYATTDSAGNFKLGNLHSGDYKIYALKEAQVNKIYDNDAELIAFQKNTIHLTHDTSGIHLNLFKQVPAKLKLIDKRIDQDGKLFFSFNKGIPDINLMIQDPDLNAQKFTDYSANGDTAQVYLPNMGFDSIKVSFLSAGKPLDTIVLHKRKNETYKRTIQLKYNLTDDRLKPGNDLIVTTNYPIQNIDKSRIILIEDTVDAGDIRLIRDENNPKLFTIKYPWKQAKHYSLSFNIGTFTDIYGDRNALAKKNFQLDKPENYGMLTLKISLPDTGNHYLVQLLNPDDGAVIHTDPISASGIIRYKDYPTAKYGIRVVYDTNNNGKWDTGDLKKKAYPENIWYLKKTLTLRPNFDIDEDIQVPKEPIP